MIRHIRLVVVIILALLIGIVVFLPIIPHHYIAIATCLYVGPCGSRIVTAYASVSCQLVGTGEWIDSDGEWHFSVGLCGGLAT